jgi:hypothetical protein
MNLRREDPESWQNVVILALVLLAVLAGLFVGAVV